jgi:uncharacterized membrane protein
MLDDGQRGLAPRHPEGCTTSVVGGILCGFQGLRMHNSRLEAFSDGVMAIIITIMVLELRVRGGAGCSDLRPVLQVLMSYVLSFFYLGIYWNNHHHLFQATSAVNGKILWANLHLLFWLSLFPFATDWLGEHPFAQAPAALYGLVLLMAAIAFLVLQRAILKVPRGNEVLAKAIGRDIKGKISPVCYGLGIGLSFVHPAIGWGIYAAVGLMWLVPDPRIERAMAGKGG